MKGVLKGGEVPPLNKKYKRISDVVVKPKSSGSPDSAESSGNLQQVQQIMPSPQLHQQIYIMGPSDTIGGENISTTNQTNSLTELRGIQHPVKQSDHQWIRATPIVPRLGLPEYSRTIQIGDGQDAATGSSNTVGNSDTAPNSFDVRVV